MRSSFAGPRMCDMRELLTSSFGDRCVFTRRGWVAIGGGYVYSRQSPKPLLQKTEDPPYRETPWHVLKTRSTYRNRYTRSTPDIRPSK
ncbi:hypothetical protein I7I53_07853 [Histoplasma capsulatum var. duboisii H88]|uniref:Uncharacterized protein n=1 Tax=Ajellomyces capsulatus (strain H88) TaxID=544711 RepID=A0A8A1LII3_AJEC8|nr:hypothetical protein I7I53_07853 [Histoplasma capsulatum var. duboisii H88]